MKGSEMFEGRPLPVQRMPPLLPAVNEVLQRINAGLLNACNAAAVGVEAASKKSTRSGF